MTIWQILKTIGVLFWHLMTLKRVGVVLMKEKAINTFETTIPGNLFNELIIEYHLKDSKRNLSVTTLPLEKGDEVRIAAK